MLILISKVLSFLVDRLQTQIADDGTRNQNQNKCQEKDFCVSREFPINQHPKGDFDIWINRFLGNSGIHLGLIQ